MLVGAATSVADVVPVLQLKLVATPPLAEAASVAACPAQTVGLLGLISADRLLPTVTVTVVADTQPVPKLAETL